MMLPFFIYKLQTYQEKERQHVYLHSTKGMLKEMG